MNNQFENRFSGDEAWIPFISPIIHEQDNLQIDRQFEKFKKYCNDNGKDYGSQLMRQINSKLPQQQPPNEYDQNLLRKWESMINKSYNKTKSDEIIHQMREESNRIENRDRKIHNLRQKMQVEGIDKEITLEEKNFIEESLENVRKQCSAQMIDNLNKVIGEIGQDWNKKILLSSIPKNVSELELFEREIPSQITDLLTNKKVKGLYDLRLDQQSPDLKKLLDKLMIDVISINFTNCNFTNSTIQQLVVLSNRIPNVTTLHLNYNQFTKLTKDQLNKMKKNMKYLTKIYILNGNDSSGKVLLPSSVSEILMFMYEQQLNEQNKHKTVVIMNQWDLFGIFQPKLQLRNLTFFNPLAFSQVTKINLHRNGLTDDDFVILTNLISQLPQLTELNLSNNQFTSFAKQILQLLFNLTVHRQEILSINLWKLVGNKLNQRTLRLLQQVFQSKKGAKITIVCDKQLKLQKEFIMREKNNLRKSLEEMCRNQAVGVRQEFIRGQKEDVNRLKMKLLAGKVSRVEIKSIEDTVSQKFARIPSTEVQSQQDYKTIDQSSAWGGIEFTPNNTIIPSIM